MHKNNILLISALIASLGACGGGTSATKNTAASSVYPGSSTKAPASSTALSSSVPSSKALSNTEPSSTSASSAAPENFTLVFRDDFNHFDSSRWQLMPHSWGGNLAMFSADTVSVADGMMKIKLLDAPPGTSSGGELKPYLGAEVRSVDTIKYGRVSARAKLAKGSAVVSALVTIYTPWPADNWNEFDIESLGKNTREIQFNSMVYTGPTLTPPITMPATPTQYPLMQDLGFDSNEDFHVYTIEWTPTEAKFLIDGVLYHRWVDRMDLIGLPQNILMTIWASNITSWAGPITADTVKGEALYDWIEVWRYNH